MICATCGANNPSESVYCGGCGSLLAPKTVVAPNPPDPEQASPAISPAPPGVPAAIEEAPTLRVMPPAQEQAAAALVIEDMPTMATEPASLATPIPQTPQPAPSASEFYNFGAPAQQGMPGAGTAPLPPTPGFPSGVQPPLAGSAPGFSPSLQPGAAFSSGFYPAPTPQPGGLASGVYPPSYQGQPYLPGWDAHSGAIPPLAAQGPGSSKLIQPLPTLAFITSILVVVIVLAVLVFFTGTDWAAGFETAGLVALIVGVLILIAFGVRSALGMLATTNPHRRSQIISSILLALILFAVGAIGLTQQSAIHNVQAHFLEGQQKWLSAVSEYQAGGQGAPSSEDIARTYNEWGESLTTQQQYSSAIDKFSTVISNYTQATTGVTRAEKDAVSAYQSWGAFDSQSQNYSAATQHYDALLNLTYCNSSCQAQANAADATAYYNLAEQLLKKQQYAGAATAFNTLTARFGNSSSAKKAHADYATALWGEGQQQLTTACSSAVTTYQQLASQFSDTPQGQNAATALKGPIQVKGQFTSPVPAASTMPVVILGTGNMTTSTTANQFAALYAGSPHTQINSDGTFQFASVKPGSYQFIWGTLNDSDGFIRVEFLTSDTNIGVLCTYDFGELPQLFQANSRLYIHR